eukprot:SAG31_NODE_5219_length_2669_cov_1.862646_1_plen_139_part_10
MNIDSVPVLSLAVASTAPLAWATHKLAQQLSWRVEKISIYLVTGVFLRSSLRAGGGGGGGGDRMEAHIHVSFIFDRPDAHLTQAKRKTLEPARRRWNSDSEERKVWWGGGGAGGGDRGAAPRFWRGHQNSLCLESDQGT